MSTSANAKFEISKKNGILGIFGLASLSFFLGYASKKFFFSNNKVSKDDDLKKLIRTSYAKIAKQSLSYNKKSCCGVGVCSEEQKEQKNEFPGPLGPLGQQCCGQTTQVQGCCGGVSQKQQNEIIDQAVMAEDYSKLEGYNKNADLGLGCGQPTEFADIKQGDYVLDLGSGAGNDCFIARKYVGEKGKVFGLDFCPEMLIAAQANADKSEYNNIEFRMGEIEAMPFQENFIDVIISNCVMNLVPDKKKAFSEVFRVLKKGGHFTISDIVIVGELPDKIRKAASMTVGCVAGALEKNYQLKLLTEVGFSKIDVKKEKLIDIPDNILLNYISKSELKIFKESGTKIYSMTFSALKPQ